MQHYACRCGKYTVFGSMGPEPCEACAICGTVPAWIEGGMEPIRPTPHVFVIKMVETDDGPKSFTRCVHCQRTKASLARPKEGVAS